jgi:hypothetical protein
MESSSMYGDDDETDEVRVFTLQEARGLMPRLRKLLAGVTKEREALLDMRVEIDLAREKASEGGGGSAFGPTHYSYR